MSRAPLLERMTSHQVGDLLVRKDRITEPKTGCCVARGFPNEAAAMAAAREMNEVADWFEIIKTRAEGRRPNCQGELRAIAERHGGKLGDGATPTTVNVCAQVVRSYERQPT